MKLTTLIGKLTVFHIQFWLTSSYISCFECITGNISGSHTKLNIQVMLMDISLKDPKQ